MKQIAGLLILTIAVTSCSSEKPLDSEKRPGINPITVEEVDPLSKYSPLAMEVKLLSDVAPSENQRPSSPSVFPISDSLSLIEHLSSDTHKPQWSFYDAYGNFIYNTSRRVSYYSIGDSYSLVQETENESHQFYFIFNHSFENLNKLSAIDFVCGKEFVIKQSDEREAIKIECEEDGHYLLADFNKRSITLRSSNGLFGRRYDPHFDWVKISPSNISSRNAVDNHNDFKLHFTPITDTNVLPIKENSSGYVEYGSKFMLTYLNKKRSGEIINQTLIIRNQTRQETDKISLEPLTDETSNYGLSYIVLSPGQSYKKRLILKEQYGPLTKPSINLISYIPFKGYKTTQNTREIICNFCEQAIREGKHLQNPAPYQACIDQEYDRYTLEDYISVTESNSIIVQFSTTTHDQRNYKGAIIMDSGLNILRTFEMQDYTGESLKFMSNSNSIYSTTSTSLYKYDQDGRIHSAVNFCSLIPNCLPQQNKTVISLKNGRFIFTQPLMSSNDVKANELIYELIVR